MKRSIPLLLAVFTLVFLAAQQSPAVLRLDVQHYEIDLEVIPENSYLRGRVQVRFKVLEDGVSIPFSLNNRISLIEVKDEEGEVYRSSFDNFDSSRMLVRGSESFRAGDERTLTFAFDGTLEPEQFAYLDDTPRAEKAVVGPEGALLLSEGLWFPSHSLPLDAATANLRVTVPLGFSVVAAGELQPIETVGISEVFTWRVSAPVGYFPVSVARYFRQPFESETVPFTFYTRGDSSADLDVLVAESEKIVEFFNSEYGEVPHLSRLNLVDMGNVRLPSTGSASLVLLESPLIEARTPRQMELARRLARQWWAYPLYIEGGYDAWLQEGFANYAALRYVESRYPDQFQTELARLAVEALKYEERAPVSEGFELGPGTPQFQSIVGAKGAWILYMLRQLMGDEKFNDVLVEWYREGRGASVSTAKLADFVNRKTGDDYRWFFLQWVESTGVPEFRIDYTVFKKSAGGFRVRGQIKQDLELFRMPTEIRFETKGQPEVKQLSVSGKNTTFNFETETMPQQIVIDPEGKILRDSEKMREAVHIGLGEEFLDQGEYVSAIREFEKAKTINPRSSYAHYRLGESFFLQHSYSNAANSFRDALNGDLQPEWVETWTHIHLGKIYDILGQRQRALAEYQKAINSKIDYNGAQDEAKKYLEEPFSKPRTLIGS